jgi:hypothetical protein
MGFGMEGNALSSVNFTKSETERIYIQNSPPKRSIEIGLKLHP